MTNLKETRNVGREFVVIELCKADAALETDDLELWIGRETSLSNHVVDKIVSVVVVVYDLLDKAQAVEQRPEGRLLHLLIESVSQSVDQTR